MDLLQTQSYLERINYTGPTKPSLELLTELQLHHLLSVPFENLDIHSNTSIDLDVACFYEKVVTRNRGGFCYELNGLFNELLLSLDFETMIISARVFSQSKGHYNPEFDHLAILVNIVGHQYLVDVGFGEFSFAPIPLIPNISHEDKRGSFKFTNEGKANWVVHKRDNKIWYPEYRFALTERKLSDFKGRCIFHQTSPDSHFTHKKICSLPTVNGRRTISGNMFVIKKNGIAEEKEMEDEAVFNQILLNHFKVKL